MSVCDTFSVRFNFIDRLLWAGGCRMKVCTFYVGNKTKLEIRNLAPPLRPMELLNSIFMHSNTCANESNLKKMVFCSLYFRKKCKIPSPTLSHCIQLWNLQAKATGGCTILSFSCDLIVFEMKSGKLCLFCTYGGIYVPLDLWTLNPRVWL